MSCFHYRGGLTYTTLPLPPRPFISFAAPEPQCSDVTLHLIYLDYACILHIHNLPLPLISFGEKKLTVPEGLRALKRGRAEGKNSRGFSQGVGHEKFSKVVLLSVT